LTTAYIGRKPVIDNNRKIHAYELNFYPKNVSSKKLSAKLLVNTFGYFGLERLVGDNLAFIVVSKEILMSELIETIEDEQVVFVLCNKIKLDESIVLRCEELRKKGFSLGYYCSATDNEFTDRLYKSIDILNIDAKKCGIDFLKKKIDSIRKYSFEIVAQNVNSNRDFIAYKKLSISLYSGYFFAKPQLFKGKKVDPSVTTTLNVIQLLQSNASTKKIEEGLLSSTALVVGILRFINTAKFSTKVPVKSLSHAINLIGRNRLIQWLMLYVYSSTKVDNYSTPLTETAILRVKIMQRLAEQLGDENLHDKLFLVGMVSLFEPLLQTPIVDIVAQLNLSKELEEAILYNKGKLGKFLKLSVIIEKGDFVLIEKVSEKIGLSLELISTVLQDSFTAMKENIANIKAK